MSSSPEQELKNYDLNLIKKNPEEYAQKVQISVGTKLIKLANHFYYTGKPFLSDLIYDKIEDILKIRSPNNKIWKEIRASFDIQEDKVKLPYWMGSMDKIKPGKNEVDKWSAKYPGPYFVSEKLDGMSCLLIITPNESKLYSRGNGQVGHDISHLLKYISLPKLNFDDKLKKLGINDTLALRGELIISKKTFNNKYLKIKTDARSMVAGLMNAKHPDPVELSDLDLLIYEMIEPIKIAPSIQFEIVDKLKFKTAKSEKITSNSIDDATAAGLLTKMKQNSLFEIDGIILTQDKPHDRNLLGNPQYSKAFKMSDDSQRADGIVEEILWDVSRWGKLIPRIKVKPVKIGHITIQKATAFNAKYIKDNQLGPGAKVKLIRSGDVIPYIESVESPAPGGASMPTVKYKFHEGGYDIYIDENDPSHPSAKNDHEIKQLTYFMTTLEAEGINLSTVKRLHQNDFKTLDLIFKMTKQDFLNLPNTQEKLAQKQYTVIQGLLTRIHPLESLMAASGIFGLGFGIRKSRAILEVYPNILTQNITLTDVININGFETKTAKLFINGLPKFKTWLKKHSFKYKLPTKKNKNNNGKLTDQHIVFTGFRDKNLELEITEEGGSNAQTINSKTTILIAKDPNAGGSKIDKAIKLKIPVMSLTQFKTKFNL